MDAQSIVARERSALAAHRASLRGSPLPSPKDAPRGTFVHGLLLPLSLLVATLRDGTLRGPFLRVAAVRSSILVVVAVLAIVSGVGQDAKTRRPREGVTVSYGPAGDGDGEGGDGGKQEPVNVDMPGLHLHLGNEGRPDHVVVLGQAVPVNGSVSTASTASPAAPASPPSFLERTRAAFARSWAWVVGLVGVLSLVEGVIVFFSRRWDDWLSFHISRLARVRPEMPEPPKRRVSFELKWMVRKLRRRIRGYLIFASGMPLLFVFRLIPVAGKWIFAAAVTLWAWYWMGVFTASKSALAWTDDGAAPPPILVRSFNARVARGWWLWPLRVYGRLWAWIVRGVSSAAATFDRSPAAFMGLALARAILALPFLYLLARPIVPVAAGRLCAEADPGDRFSVEAD
jgi:hypothetical protein